MIGQMPPLFKGQRLRATGVGVLDVNAVEAQQRKTDRKGARRPSAGEPVVVAGDFNDWRQQANQPLKAQAGLEEIFTRARGQGIDPLRQHGQLRLPLVGA